MNANQRFWKNWQLITKFACLGSMLAAFATLNIWWLAVLPIGIVFIIVAGYFEMKAGQ